MSQPCRVSSCAPGNIACVHFMEDECPNPVGFLAVHQGSLRACTSWQMNVPTLWGFQLCTRDHCMHALHGCLLSPPFQQKRERQQGRGKLVLTTPVLITLKFWAGKLRLQLTNSAKIIFFMDKTI